MGPARHRQGSARHGTYSFLFWDADDNAWEILSNPRAATLDLRAGDLEAAAFRARLPAQAPDAKNQAE